MNDEQILEYLRSEREAIEWVLRIKHVDITKLNERLAHIERQIQLYEMER